MGNQERRREGERKTTDESSHLMFGCRDERRGRLPSFLPPRFSNQGLHYSVGKIPSKGGEDVMLGIQGDSA